MKKNTCVMVVDDEPTVLRLLDRTLKPAGYDVVLASDGNLALKLLEQHSPDLVILDLMMPEKDGFSIFNTIRQISPYSRIIIYTGYGEHQDSVYARAADRFLVKGKSMEELVNAVEELSL